MYQPNKKIIERYADVLVNFALHGGRGMKKGEMVLVVGSESTKPLFVAVLNAITKAGGHVIKRYLPDNDKHFNADRDFYLNATEQQLKFFPAKYYRGLVDEMHHSIFIEGEADVEALRGIDPKKIMTSRQSIKPYREWRDAKEGRGEFSWTLALYGTPAMAREAGLSEKEYWQQIIDACFLNSANPVGEWRRIQKEIERTATKLDNLPIEKLHVVGPDADLWVKVGEKRIWEGGRGANIPSFEIFTSPDWRGTEGWMRFNQPCYSGGNLIKGVELEFKKGKIVRSSARVGEQYLKELIKTPNADKIGEYSLTDKRFSRITKFMATTLYDENIGGPNGNTHLAIGSSYHDCYDGDPSKPSRADWDRLGFNASAIHQDFISTAPRTVTAYLKGGKGGGGARAGHGARSGRGKEKVIYKNGMFVL
jgi:aminopeptidase